jgi:hypothetical protein
VSELVDQLNTPPPDGSIPPDPPPVDPSTLPPEIIPRDEINAFLQLERPADVTAYIRDLNPEEESYFLDQINANALALSASQQLWGAFCDNLSEAGFRTFIDSADPDILDMRYARIAAEQYRTGFEQTLGEGGLPLCRTLFEISDEVRVDFFLLFTETQKAEVESIWDANRPDQAGLSAEEIYRVTEEEVEARRMELLTTDEQPAFARFLRPGEFSKAYLANVDDDDTSDTGNGRPPAQDDDDDHPNAQEDEEEQARNSSSGGGCFIATCAYGDYDHPDVMYLRLFRDLVLADYAPGRRFIRFYYRVGPSIATALAPYPRLKGWVRAGLSHAVRGMQVRHLRKRR